MDRRHNLAPKSKPRDGGIWVAWEAGMGAVYRVQVFSIFIFFFSDTVFSLILFFSFPSYKL